MTYKKGNIPWSKGKKNVTNDKPNSRSFKKGMIPWNKGVAHSKKTRDKISMVLKEKHKNNILVPIFLNRKHSKESIDKMRLAKLGKKMSIECRKKMSLSSNKSNIGRFTSERMKGKNNPMYGNKHSNKIIEAQKLLRAKQVFPLKDSSIEIKMQSFLKQLGIEFSTHQYIKDIEHGYQCDIFIPVQKGITKKTVIECDGTYWHNYPIGNEKDILRGNELRDKGYRVLRFWENEIRVMQLQDLRNKFIEINK